MKKALSIIIVAFIMVLLSAGTIYAASAPKLNRSSIQLQKGETAELSLKGAKAGKVKWSSKNKAIAEVKEGVVTAKEAGTTKIIARYKGKKYVCKVVVTDPADVPDEDEKMILTIDGTKLDVTWENNESVEALKKLLPLTLSMSEYGGFEQVGKIGTSLPNNDERITANAGDIVLYSGDKMISLEGCRTLYLGYPIWWGQAPRIMDTFVEGHDLTGITVIPFCTSGSSGIGNSAGRLEKLAGCGIWKTGKRFPSGVDNSSVREWIESLNGE